MNELHIAEIKEDRLKEVAAKTKPVTATTDYRQLLANKDIDAIMISATPETTHYPMAKESLQAGKHVFLEKPIALELWEADDLIASPREKSLLFTIGYSQRFNPKFAYVKRSIDDGTIGEPVQRAGEPPHHPQPRQENRRTHQAFAGRDGSDPRHRLRAVVLRAAQADPRVLPGSAQDHEGQYNVPDCAWIIVTLDDGSAFTIGAGWVLPPAYPNFSSTWIEMVGTEGAIMVDDTHRDVALNTPQARHRVPDLHDARRKSEPRLRRSDGSGNAAFPRMRGARQAAARHRRACRMVMQVYQAADLSAETGTPVDVVVRETSSGGNARAERAP